MMSKPRDRNGRMASGAATSMTPGMREALALVRGGRLQEASALLMDLGMDLGLGLGTGMAMPPQSLRGAAHRQEALNTLMRQSKGSTSSRPHHRAEQTAPAGPGARSHRAPGRFDPISFAHQNERHPCFLYTPETAAPGGLRPLVLMLHGCTQDAQDFARGTRMNATAEASGALVLYPTQSHSANAQGCWNWFKPEHQHAGAGEPKLLMAMLRQVMDSNAVDPTRIYVAGLSAGGAMAAVLAQQHPEVFAAVGVHSGLPPGAASNTMGALSAMKSGAKAWRPPAAKVGAPGVPMIVMHGDADGTVHHRNAEQLLQSAVAGFSSTVQIRDEGVSRDGQRYTRHCVVDAAAPEQLVAEHWLLHGAGHAWSGGDAAGSHASARGVDASAEMLRFFLSQTRHKRKARD